MHSVPEANSQFAGHNNSGDDDTILGRPGFKQHHDSISRGRRRSVGAPSRDVVAGRPAGTSHNAPRDLNGTGRRGRTRTNACPRRAKIPTL